MAAITQASKKLVKEALEKFLSESGEKAASADVRRTIKEAVESGKSANEAAEAALSKHETAGIESSLEATAPEVVPGGMSPAEDLRSQYEIGQSAESVRDAEVAPITGAGEETFPSMTPDEELDARRGIESALDRVSAARQEAEEAATGRIPGDVEGDVGPRELQGPRDEGFDPSVEGMNTPFVDSDLKPVGVPDRIGDVTVDEDALAVAPTVSADEAITPAPGGSKVRAMQSPEAASKRMSTKGKIATAVGLGGGSAAGAMVAANRGEPEATGDEILTAAEEGRQQAKKEMVDEAATDIATSVKEKLKGYVPPSLEIQQVPTSLAKGAPTEVLETAAEYQKAVDGLDAEGKRFANTAEGQTFTEKLAGEEQSILQAWNTRKNELNNLYKETKRDIGWAKAAEMLGHALVRLGAGLYGLRTGVDMSGVKFDMNDWSKEFDRALDEHRLELSNLEKDTEAKKEAVGIERKTYEDWSRRAEQARNRLAEAQQSTDQFNISQANQQASQERDRLLNIWMANTREQNDKAKALFDASLKAAPADKTMGDMQESLARAMFQQDYNDWTKSTQDFASGLSLLQEAQAEGDRTKRAQLVRSGLDKVAPGLQDPSQLAELQKGAEEGWIFKSPNYGKLIEDLRSAPRKEQPQAGNYLPGGAKWPGIGAGVELITGKTGAPAGGTTPPASGTITIKHKASGETQTVKRSAAGKYLNNPEFEEVK